MSECPRRHAVGVTVADAKHEPTVASYVTVGTKALEELTASNPGLTDEMVTVFASRDKLAATLEFIGWADTEATLAAWDRATHPVAAVVIGHEPLIH